ncbi:MAG: hypothetical protein ACYCZI_01810 [Metallibacterium scheffleri]
MLRLDQVDGLDPAVLSITPSDDVLRILYIGGHKPSDGPKDRFNAMLKAARAAQQYYEKNKYAWNDKLGGWGHPVAGMLTTALLRTGFRIDKCQAPCDSILQRVWRLSAARDAMSHLYHVLGAIACR